MSIFTLNLRDVTSAIDRQTTALRIALGRIAKGVEALSAPAPLRPAFKVAGVMQVPRKGEQHMISTGNHEFDKVILRLTVTPDGALDAAPTWVCDNIDVLLTVNPTGLQCDATADVDVASFSVTVTAPADNSSTPELESVSETFTGSFSHSKAKSLGGSFSEIPRV